MIEATIYATLKNDAGVTALVSSRIYPVVMPEGTALPAVVYQRISTNPVASLDGDSGLDLVRMQISSWGKSYSSAKVLAAAVRTSLVGANALKLRTESEQDDYDPETRLHRVISDFIVWQ